MSKAILGLAVLGGLGAYALWANRSSASENGLQEGAPPGGALVTGASGTTYGLVKIDSQDVNGTIVERWAVSDGLGPMLVYVQDQGDDSERMMLALSPGRTLEDGIVQNAIADFGIFTG